MLLLVVIENIVLWVNIAEYVGRYHLGLHLLYHVLIYQWLLWVASILLTAREGALKLSFLVKAPLPALLAEGILAT